MRRAHRLDARVFPMAASPGPQSMRRPASALDGLISRVILADIKTVRGAKARAVRLERNGL